MANADGLALMPAQTEGFAGTAIFGTHRNEGLKVYGNGIFSDERVAMPVFEFSVGQDRDTVLHGPDRTSWYIFCRCAYAKAEGTITKEHFIILGWLRGCRDSHGRRGFCGAAVAFRPDDPDPRQPHALTRRADDFWMQALEEARYYFDEVVERHLHADGTFAPSGALNLHPRRDDCSRSLKLDGSGEVWMTFRQEDQEKFNEIPQRLQALTFFRQGEAATRYVVGTGEALDADIFAPETTETLEHFQTLTGLLSAHYGSWPQCHQHEQAPSPPPAGPKTPVEERLDAIEGYVSAIYDWIDAGGSMGGNASAKGSVRPSSPAGPRAPATARVDVDPSTPADFEGEEGDRWWGKLTTSSGHTMGRRPVPTWAPIALGGILFAMVIAVGVLAISLGGNDSGVRDTGSADKGEGQAAQPVEKGAGGAEK